MMRLLSFEVQGFKNLVAPVKLEELGPINVLHGANNVGKSNVLQAMELFFFLVGSQGVHVGPAIPLAEEELVRRGFPSADIFNLGSPVPIQLHAELTLSPDELERAEQTTVPPPPDRFRVALELRWIDGHTTCSIETTFGSDRTLPDDLIGRAIAAVISSRSLPLAAEPAARCVRIGVERLDDRSLALALYDAKDSPDIAVSRLWDRFVETMDAFGDVIGPGRLIATYDRKAERANLLLQTAKARIPLRLLGSGVQQIVALFGRILTCGASIVLVEEPEVNLRWSLQERARDALRELVGKEGAPSQIFLSSHSGAFESGETFYLMQPGPEGPTVERRPMRDAPLVLGGPVPEVSVNAPRAPTNVSNEGTLRLPERIRKAVGVEHGGGVCFVDKGDGVAEMMSVDTFLKYAGLDDDDA